MSSHHFVTDRQSSALFIYGNAIAPDLLMELLEWNALVVTTEAQVPWLHSLRVRIDVVIGSDGQVVSGLPYDVELANGAPGLILSQLVEQGRAGRIVLVGVDPASEELRELDSSSDAWFYGDQKWVKMERGQRYAKWFPEGRRLELLGSDYRILEGECTVVNSLLVVNRDGWIKIIADKVLFIAEFY